MTAQVVTITSGKGGVGKTTAVANLAVALAADGRRVVCLDGDIGLRNLDVVMGLENRIVYDIVDVIEGRCRLRQAMIRDKHFPELYLIPAAQTRDKNAVSPSDMVRVCDELRADHDFVLIDSPAGIERGFRNAIAAADRVLVITNPEVSAVRDADRVVGILEAEGKYSPALIINRLNPMMVKNHDMLSADDVLDLLAISLIGIVPEDDSVIIGSNRGAPVAADPKSRAGAAFRNIAKRMQGLDVPFLDMDKQSGLWDRLSRMAGGRKP
jgi:septum site-determining protein MinD